MGCFAFVVDVAGVAVVGRFAGWGFHFPDEGGYVYVYFGSCLDGHGFRSSMTAQRMNTPAMMVPARNRAIIGPLLPCVAPR